MPRTLSAPRTGATPNNVAPILSGGIEADTLEQGAINLRGIRYSDLGTANGAGTLDETEHIPISSFPTNAMYVPFVEGDLTIFVGYAATYKITNYDSQITYTVTADKGSVSINGDTIHYLAPSYETTAGFTINGRLVEIVISPKPTVIGPASVYVDSVSEYTISNYDETETYVVEATAGTVVRVGDSILYYAPSQPIAGGFVVNDRPVSVAVLKIPPVSLSGVMSVYATQSTTFTITNYNPDITYTLTALSGTVSRSGNTITYTAPLKVGPTGFIVNGVFFIVSVLAYASPVVSGASTIYVNATSLYTITNYDSTNTYTLTVNGGTATRNGATITYTAPADSGSYGFTLSGIGGGVHTSTINVVHYVPTLSVTSLSMDMLTTRTFTISNYNANNEYNVSTNGGTVSRDGNTITYTAPATGGNYTITVTGSNGSVSLAATVTAITVNAPILSNLTYHSSTSESGETLYWDYAGTASAYQLSNGSTAGYTRTEWEFNTGQLFTTSGLTLGESGSTMGTQTAPATGRVRHYSSVYGYSAWSNSVAVTIV